jgi:hypothetical protein
MYNCKLLIILFSNQEYPLYLSVITGDQMYCYVHETCTGGHPSSLPQLAGFGECCSNGGRSWGLADGHENSACMACPVDGDFAGDPRKMLMPSGKTKLMGNTQMVWKIKIHMS